MRTQNRYKPLRFGGVPSAFAWRDDNYWREMHQFTHLICKVRGDGRTYMVQLGQQETGNPMTDGDTYAWVGGGVEVGHRRVVTATRCTRTAGRTGRSRRSRSVASTARSTTG